MKSLGFGGACSLLCAIAIQCSPIVVTTGVSCSTNQGTMTNNSACTIAGAGTSSPGGASASITSVWALSGNAFSVSSLGSATATETFSSTSVYAASANSNSSLAIDFSTTGTLRSGWVLVTGSEGYAAAGPGPDSSANTAFTLGTTSLGSTAVMSACSSLLHGAANNHCGNIAGLQPIMLGTDIDFAGSIVASADSATILGTANAQAAFNVTFQFFESDEATPVMLVSLAQSPTYVPEPRTWALLVAGGLGVFLLRAQGIRLKSL